MPWERVLVALWLFLPAFVANMSPVFTAKLIPWDHPIDGGRLHKDGRRMLGDGKTWRGLIGGALTAGSTALLLAATATGIFQAADFGRPASPWWAIFLFGAAMGGAALTGDAVESYFKRRRGKDRGAPWIPFDQLDFVVFGLLGAFAAAPLLDAWAWRAFGDPWVLGTLLVGTPILHLSVNRIGYWMHLKEVPW